MRQQHFEAEGKVRWQAIEKLLNHDLKKKNNTIQPSSTLKLAKFPSAYRALCQDLSLARDRQYSESLIYYLNHLVLQGHQSFYQRKAYFPLRQFIFQDFPKLVRQQGKLLWVAAALFYIPLFVMSFIVWESPEMIYSLLSHEEVASFESMYKEGNEALGRERQTDTDIMMFGFYIQHNTSIGFQAFAWGIFFGLGSLFLLFLNGLMIGAVAGYITYLGYAKHFFPFVIGHGAFELTAIILSGLAGLHLGLALVNPGRLSRIAALQKNAQSSIKIIYGCLIMFFIAAFIEAFWSSSSTLPSAIKYSVGLFFWLLVFVYFTFSGRSNAAR